MDNELREILMGISGDIKGIRADINEINDEQKKMRADIVEIKDELKTINSRLLKLEESSTRHEEELGAIRKELEEVQDIKSGQLLNKQRVFDVVKWKVAIEERLTNFETGQG